MMIVPKEAPSDASGKNAVEAVMFVPVSAPVTPNVPATVAFHQRQECLYVQYHLKTYL